MSPRPLKAVWSLAFGAGLALVGWPAQAEVITLQNDSFVDGGAVWFQQGFIVGEGAGVTLGPVSSAFTVQKIHFLFGGAATTQTITLTIYEDTGAIAPGTELFTADYQVQGADDALQEIDLTADNVQVAGGSIRVVFTFQHADLPSVAREDGCTPNVNWVYGNIGAGMQWYEFCTIPLPGVKGDWVIRAEVNTVGGTGGTGGTGLTGGTGGTGLVGGTGGTGAAGMLCTPGQSISCVGPGACQGGQTCLPDGSGYGACECGPASEDDGGCALGADRASEGGGPFGLAALASLLLFGWSRRRQRG